MVSGDVYQSRQRDSVGVVSVDIGYSGHLNAVGIPLVKVGYTGYLYAVGLLVAEREAKEIELWDDYLIYSVMFGQNKKIIEEYEKYIEIIE